MILTWTIFGAAASLVLLAKMNAAGVMPLEEPMRGVTLAGLLAGGAILFGLIGSHLEGEVIREKISRATYWTTVFGIAVASFTLLGITGVDDLLALFNKYR
ncbi:hypothetical protein [Streptomyces hydrogenans]|uniref:Integral membrane protein n=1 Tax=Streptomyces hydrogenans TaxID=1873719 RepID=A0ABQ3PMG9_9ACTN|nr:hypothetical protein [Streptomyces hydrogenans]GHI26226.1 hypothetical protein Shyd_75970 [Streptomyces hydrogenans]